MSDEYGAGIGPQDVWLAFQIVLGDHVKGKTLCLGPDDEVAFVAGPAGIGITQAVAVGIGPFLVGIARRRTNARWVIKDAAGRAPGLPDETPASRADGC